MDSPAAAKTNAALEIADLTIEFGGLLAVDSLTFSVEPGACVGLVGPNGAGKSTLIQAINGFLKPSKGRVALLGRDVTGARPEQVAALGLGRTFQTSRVFPALTVLESVLIGVHRQLLAEAARDSHLAPFREMAAALLGTPGYRRRQQELVAEAERVMRLFGDRLWDRRNDQAHTLSYANRRRLDIARALAGAPKVLLLDEPTAGMNPSESLELADVLAQVRAALPETAIVMVEHKLEVVRKLADRCVVMNQGQLVIDAPPEEALADPKVAEVYLGRRSGTRDSARTPALALAEPKEAAEGVRSVAALDGANVFYGAIQALFDVTVEVKEGEVVSVLGGNASGKSTTLKTLLGLAQARQGGVRLFGEDVLGRSTAERIALGVASIPEGRRMFAEMTVADNLLIGAYARRRQASFDATEALESVYEAFPWIAERRRQLAGTLSGGEQQMVALARAWLRRPKLLFVDEPSMGLSPAMVDRVYEVLWTWKESGLPILMVEQNANRALELADKVYVLQNGRIVVQGEAAELRNDPAIKQAYLGG